MTAPLISVVVPTYARPLELRACLAALGRSDYPRDRFEVVVVDDGSPDPIEIDPALVGAPVRLIRQANGGAGRARNRGLEHAAGELIAFTDDDCTPEPDWLSQLARAHALRPDAALGGRTVNRLPRNLCSTASQVLIDYLYGWYNADPDAARFFTSNNLAFPTAALRALGGFDTRFPGAAGEDRELCDRWLHHGHALRYVPEAVVGHAHRLDVRRFWSQHQAYGRAAYYVHQARADRAQAPVRLERPGFYLGMLAFPLHARRPVRSAALSGLLAVSQAANALGYFGERWRGRVERRGLAADPSPSEPRS